MTTVDNRVEHAGRWLAARTSRRSFLGRVGRTAVLVAGGPALAGMLTHQAEARVCGQTGISGPCATYDCEGPDSMWGWCWYTSPGCCANGGLKKICDCCTINWPNVHGYCPAGANVRCIVESCYADPRVMSVPVTRLDVAGPIDASIAVAARRFPERGPAVAVVSDADDLVAAAVAAGVAGAADAPLLLTAPGMPDAAVLDALQRLSPNTVVVCGPNLGQRVGGYMGALGFEVETIGTPGDLASTSADAARWVIERVGATRALLVDAAATAIAPTTGALALLARCPVVIDAGHAADAGIADIIPAGIDPAQPPAAAARDIASLASGTLGLGPMALTLVPADNPSLAAGIAGLGTLVLYHEPGVLDMATQAWAIEHQPHIRRGFVAGRTGAVDNPGVYQFQSALNHFDAHLLTGQSGQGLPVFSQPVAERPIGNARLAGLPSSDAQRGRLIARANPDRQ